MAEQSRSEPTITSVSKRRNDIHSQRMRNLEKLDGCEARTCAENAYVVSFSC